MLARVQEKLACSCNKGQVFFQQGDIRSVDLGRQFDAALMMFAVLGYQLENADVLAALKTARQHLQVGGLLIFDVWYGPAVLHQRPSQRVKIMPTQEGRILRIASGDVDVPHHTCTVRYHIWRLAGDHLLSETEEVHRMRYFFPLELQLFLECAGFTLIRLGAFPEFNTDPDETTWNVLGVVRAV
jgi:SAM-dependent methyltransferase